MCSRLNEQEALFARVQKSTCAKVMPTVCIMFGLAEWENEMKLSNEMHCICILQRAKSHAPTYGRTNARWYSIFDMCGMINFVRDGIWICKDRINTQIPIVLFKHHISNLAQVDFCTLANNASCSSKREHIPHKKWYQMIWDKTIFHEIYNYLLFIDDF